MNTAPKRLSDAPALFDLGALATSDEIQQLLGLLSDEDTLAIHGVSTHRSPSGASWELPVAAHPALQAIAARALEAAALPDAALTHLRLRRYIAGQGHPPHLDDYEIRGQRLAATVLIGLEQAPEGGHTRFPDAAPAPVAVALAPGQGLLWYNLRADMTPDPAARHDAEAVTAGHRAILAAFLYAAPEALAGHPALLPAPAHPERLVLLVDDTTPALIQQIRRACTERGVRCDLLDARTFDMTCFDPLEPGAMLYRPATSHRACVIEQLLVHDRVATFYDDALGPHLIWDNQAMLLSKMGVPTPRAFYALTTSRAALRAQVEALGGLPVILKIPGRSLGVGVMRLDDWPALFSVVDATASLQGQRACLMACVEPAEHWRVIIVGAQAAAAYRNHPEPDDFRTFVDEEDPDAFREPPPDGLIDLAARATAALGLSFGGVDLLVHPSGRMYVLEVNFPCYFGHPWSAARIDVAGAMVDHLRARAAALR